MTEPTDKEIRAVQKARSRWTAFLLLGFVVLIFFITLAKMAVT